MKGYESLLNQRKNMYFSSVGKIQITKGTLEKNSANNNMKMNKMIINFTVFCSFVKKTALWTKQSITMLLHNTNGRKDGANLASCIINFRVV